MSTSNIAELLKIPDVRMGERVKVKDTVSDIKNYGNAIDQVSTDMLDAILGVESAMAKVEASAEKADIPPMEMAASLEAAAQPPKNKGGRPKKKVVAVASILHDGALEDRAEILDRADEYMRFQAVELYEQSKDMLSQIKSELIQGAAPQMWQAYTGLLKAVGECHKRLSEVYEKIRQKYEFDAPFNAEEEIAKVEAPKSMKASMDELYEMLEASRGKVVDAADFDKIKSVAIEATCDVVDP